MTDIAVNVALSAVVQRAGPHRAGFSFRNPELNSRNNQPPYSQQFKSDCSVQSRRQEADLLLPQGTSSREMLCSDKGV